ncbi:stage II sporulation protein M [Brachybacterium endophyticum]|uniref:Stage II sporulation protein M n=1 Tax=Brachybacterium endophyticum TaxID=2182385 RepID=A0A2U2RH07_9MICO|nr:stage II sporulation protein M [Brachybacterium endophyticum]PWH05152.1 stage II sporulation protein M [Brachybacterium endophyticum]
MDTDAFIAVHQGDWDRLGLLTRTRTLDAEGVEELIALYRRTATHLSIIRSTNPDPVLTARLSVLLQRARLRITGARVPMWRRLRDVLWEDVPAAMYDARWCIAVCGALLLLSAVISGIWFGVDPSARSAVLSADEQRQLAEHDFVGYYFEGHASGFAANVWTNNAWIALQSVVLGVTGVWPLWMILSNGLNIGVSAGVLGAHGQIGTLLVYLLPHGLLEITAICVGAGAGLRLFWAWVRPGPLPRTWALAHAARAMITVGIGLVLVLLVSGVLEAFVTPSPLPAPLRIAIGVIAWAGFLAVLLIRGRTVHRAGITGDLDEESVGDTVAVAA